MARQFCCVCDLPIEGEVFLLGGRAYDSVHYQRVALENKGAARPIFALLFLLILFSIVVALLSNSWLTNLQGINLMIVGVLVALVPAVIWLFVFYKQDRLEPEPKQYVLGIFILGGLLAAAIGQPIIQDSFRIQEWSGHSWVISILGSIFIAGFIQEFLKYAAVRYSIYYSSEFDERVDGIIYAAAAGLGYATVLNLQYVIGNAGVNLGIGVILITVNALAQASFAAICGYFLGRAKFEEMGPLWLPAGLTTAAVLNGIVTFILNYLPTIHTSVRNSSFHIWYALAGAALVAGIIFILLFRMIRRLNAQTLAIISANITRNKES